MRARPPVAGRVEEMGDRIDFRDDRWVVPDHPDHSLHRRRRHRPDIWRAARRVFDAAVEKAYGGERRVEWLEVLAGEKAFKRTGEWLPEETLDALQTYRVAIKGPLTTPVGGGIRSLNVDAAPGARSVRLHPAGALLRGRAGAGQASRRSSTS